MKRDSKTEQTLQYYNQHGEAFFAGTIHVDMSEFYEEFLPLIPKCGHILDVGCGSGRDTRAFLDRGYQVTAFDASEKMVALASEYTGQAVELMSVLDIQYQSAFDGVWASASLLHLGEQEVREAVKRLALSLRPEGVLYMSFKYGNGQREVGGRLFTDFNEATGNQLISMCSELEVIKSWQSLDKRSDQPGQKWQNLIAQKVSVG